MKPQTARPITAAVLLCSALTLTACGDKASPEPESAPVTQSTATASSGSSETVSGETGSTDTLSGVPTNTRAGVEPSAEKAGDSGVDVSAPAPLGSNKPQAPTASAAPVVDPAYAEVVKGISSFLGGAIITTMKKSVNKGDGSYTFDVAAIKALFSQKASTSGDWSVYKVSSTSTSLVFTATWPKNQVRCVTTLPLKLPLTSDAIGDEIAKAISTSTSCQKI